MSISVRLSVSPFLNLALQTNQVPALRELSVHNDGPESVSSLSLRLSSNPAAALHHHWPELSLAPGEHRALDLKAVALDYDFFHALDEGITGYFVATLMDMAGEIIATDTAEARLLPPKHWGGSAAVPELLAAHVLPNDPAVGTLLRRAAELIGTQHLALNGYEGNAAAQVGAQLVAILTAIREQNLYYALPPQSFERVGQRIRTPTEVLADGLGTCLDLACLAAAALEQAGLHPGIVLVEGHAYLICWLAPSPIHTGTLDDLQALRKAAAAGLLLAAETTLLVGPNAEVNASLSAGQRALDQAKDFYTLVDLHAARQGEGIRPLGQERLERKTASYATASTGLDLSALADLPGASSTSETSAFAKNPSAPVPKGAARVDQWKQRLLDLTRRNRLLNWKPRRADLPLPHVDAAAIEDALAAGTAFRFEGVDTERGRGAALARERAAEHYADSVRNSLASGVLLVTQPPATLLVTLLKLERDTRLAIEEGGSSTLFLALGFVIKPLGGAQEGAEYCAPLILLPVELKRRRAGNTFALARRDEEAILNPTLQEFLRREHGITFEGLTEELPTDDRGIDVPQVFAKARQALLALAGWELREDVALGSFSFAKYLMWRDLDRFEVHLRENPVVAHLIERPREPYYVPGTTNAIDYPDRETLDASFPATEMLTPLSADASQLAAVRAASLGLDFVLEGPPGTGKSQTITNLIAQCLGEGKSVLFVSEKTAALEVVERRLVDIGLGDFCLELHSNKVTKTHVYNQLRAAWTVEVAPAQDWAAEAARLGQLRAELNAQVEALHQVHPSGYSVYTAISTSQHPAAADAPHPPAAWALSRTAADLQSAEDLAGRLGATLADVPAASHAALAPLWGPFEPERLAAAAQATLRAVADFGAARSAFTSAIGIAAPDQSRVTNVQLATLAALLLRARGRDYTRLTTSVESGRERRQRLEEAGALEALAASFGQLHGRYRPELVSLPAASLLQRWGASEAKFGLLRWWERRGLRKEVQSFATGEIPDDLGAELQTLVAIAAERDKLAALGAPIPVLTSEALATAGQDAIYFRDWIGFMDQASSLGLRDSAFAKTLDQLAEDASAARAFQVLAEAYQTRWSVLDRASDELTQAMGAASNAGTPSNAEVRHVEAHAQVREDLRPAAPAPFHPGPAAAHDESDGAADYLAFLSRRANGLLEHREQWRVWAAFAEARRNATAAGLGYLAEALLGRPGLSAPAVQRDFRLGFAYAFAQAAIAREPRLSGFSGSVQAEQIRRFGELDRVLAKTIQAEIRSRLLAKRASLYTQELRPHLAVWNSERDKKRKQLPVRPLIAGLGPLLTELTPCLLMSPLSVAQYLPADRALRFDVVVFDEASQIPVWDAVGAIARGKQVIVVGDSKQLPPTSFFAKADSGETSDLDAEEVIAEDMESILDEMQAASLLSRRLRWHYRSRAEGLIAFSNKTYYEGELSTFPAPLAEDRSVQYHKVDSLDYRAGSNEAEAKALVDYLVGRLLDPEVGDRTFGVVTFGMAQRTVIEDLLERARGEHPALDRHFDPDRDERVFVKNIENVQGDERDVILFSITYGPDAQGKLRMNFGPMNAVGGERRLNVAVTRARREMHLFTSIEPEEVDLKRLGANATGARDLRRFLEFARRGAKAFLGGASAANPSAQGGELRREIAEALRAQGFQIDEQVGVSGYRVDLGVRDPECTEGYRLGIELDGASYRDGATARERELLRRQVLEGLGWRLVRVWSLEWWFDKERALKKLIAEIEAAEQAAVAHSPVPVSDTAAALLHDPKGFAKTAERFALDFTSAPAPPALYRQLRAEDFADLRARLQGDAAASFFETAAGPVIEAMARLVIEREAPILLDEAVKRIASAGFELPRSSSRVRERILFFLRKEAHVAERDGELLTFASAEQAALPLIWRAPAPGGVARGAAEVPLAELTALVRELLPSGLDGDALIREVGVRLGLGSVRGSSRERVEKAMEGAWG